MKNVVSAEKSLNFSATTMLYWEMKKKVYKPKIITFRQTKNTYFKLLNQELSNVLAQMTSMNTGETVEGERTGHPLYDLGMEKCFEREKKSMLECFQKIVWSRTSNSRGSTEI